MFKQYKYGFWKKEIRNLLRERLKVLDKIRYCKNKIASNEDKINLLKKDILPKVEKDLDFYLKKAGN